MDSLQHAAVLWLIGAITLAIAEIVLPGVYMIFFAAAAALTGAVALLFPELSLGGQLLGFAGWSVAAVLIGRRWYRDFPVESADPMLNDRIARLVGETVLVVEPIGDGPGRVRVGDGEWPAEGVEAPAGARVRITGARGATLIVEAAPALPPQ
ncbi:NfeD family protein [Sphingomonas sp. RS6]